MLKKNTKRLIPSVFELCMIAPSDVFSQPCLSPENQSLACPLTPNIAHLRLVARCQYPTLASLKNSPGRSNNSPVDAGCGEKPEIRKSAQVKLITLL